MPANIYGKKVKSESIQIKQKDFVDAFNQVGETGLLYLALEDAKGKAEARPVLIANIQKNPIKDQVIHVDFHQVDLKEKVAAEVPVELTGVSPVEKQGVGTIVQYLNEIEVEALPTDLPEKFAIDVSILAAVDQAIYVKDLEIDKAKVEVKTDPEGILVKVEPPQKEEVVAPPPTEAVPAEGEVPAEKPEEEPKAQATKQ